MAGADRAFAARYGPWALVLGASNGVGESFARKVAERGVNVVLVSRRQAVLDEVAASITKEHGVEARAVAVDLAASDAAERVRAATDGLEVGMLMYCAGADPNYLHFVDAPLEYGLEMVQRNCVVPMVLCHHFGGAMAARGRGGVILVASAAGLHGQPNMAVYGASKAFDIMLAEALWGELGGRGVDVLTLVLGATDTPEFRRILHERGVIPSVDEPIPFPDVTSSDEAASDAIEYLGKGPTRLVGERTRERLGVFATMTRNDVVATLVQSAGGIMRNDESG